MRLALRTLGAAAALAGAALLAVALLGRFTALGDYESYDPSRSRADRLDRDLVAATPDLDALHRAAEARAGAPLGTLPPERAMQALYDAVTLRFAHGDQALYNLFSNWTMLVAARWDETYGIIHVPDLLLAHGYSAICDQLAYVLFRLAERAGIRGRLVVLHGHVVMEAFYDGAWRMYDPDVELVPRGADGAVLSVEALEDDAELTRSFYEPLLGADWAKDVVENFTSKENNMRWDELAPREWLREEHAQPLRFVIPAFAVLFGIGLIAAARPPRP